MFDRLYRNLALRAYMANPVLRERLREEAEARHQDYLDYLQRHGLLTEAIIEDHRRQIEWCFDLGGC